MPNTRRSTANLQLTLFRKRYPLPLWCDLEQLTRTEVMKAAAAMLIGFVEQERDRDEEGDDDE